MYQYRPRPLAISLSKQNEHQMHFSSSAPEKTHFTVLKGSPKMGMKC